MNKNKSYFKLDKETISLYGNVFLSYGFKGSSLILSFFLTPLYFNYFENQVVLGGWFTVLSILNWIIYFDLGIGNGLRNRLSVSFYKNNEIETRQIISSTYIIMFIILSSFLILGFILIYIVDINSILGIPKELVGSKILKYSTVILLIGIFLSFYLNLTTSIMHSLQMSGLTGSFSLITNVLILFFILFFDNTTIERKFLYLAITFSISVSLPLVVATIWIFWKKLKIYRPNIAYYNRSVSKAMIKLGGAFFWIQIGLMVINSTDQVIITQLFGSSKVVEYQIYHKIFYLAITMFSLVSNPLWASISKASSEGRVIWIKKIKNKMYLYAIIFSFFVIFITVFNQYIFDIWLQNDSIKVKLTYSIVFLVYSIIMVWTLTVTAIANGLNYLKIQLYVISFGMLLKIPFIYILYNVYDSWIIIVLVNTLIMGANMIFNAVYIERKLHRLMFELINEEDI
jgi:O-antigen/teichoic acid export membrane protein